MTDNPQSVANLFGAPYGGVTPTITGTSAQGLANQLDVYLQPLITYEGTLSQTQDSINNQITNVQQQISNFSQQVTDYQNSLVSQYAQLNTVISGWDAQGNWLTQQVNAMTSSKS
jgi:flagellar hook-associated protein 2